MRTFAHNRKPVDLKVYGPFPTIAEMEERLIHRALKKTQGNRLLAAMLLDIHVKTLRKKLREYAAKS
jgi:DNA-binding protein Fis